MPAEDEESVVREKQKADLIMASTSAANTEYRYNQDRFIAELDWAANSHLFVAFAEQV